MRAGGRWAALLADAGVAAVVAAVVFQLLCRHVGDRYDIPTDSMQPTLFGDPVHGDVVYVDKLAPASGLQRYDLAVFERDGGERQLVKRVVVFGDDPDRCAYELSDGDLWLGRTAAALTRDQKDPQTTRDLRVPWFAWPRRGDEPLEHVLALPEPPAGDDAPLRLPSLADPAAVQAARARQAAARAAGDDPGPGDGWLWTVRAIDAGYLDALGRRRREGAGVQVQDCGLDLDVVADGLAHLYCGVDLRPDTVTFHWDRANGRAELWHDGETFATRAMPALDGPRHRVEFGFLDGRFFLLLDDVRETLWTVDRGGWARDPGPVARPLPRARLLLGGIATGPLHVERLLLFRDLYWYRERIVGRQPQESLVAAGHVVLLGDNSFDSNDSRMFGPVPLADFVGRPRAILGPPSRRQWLAR